MYTYKLVLSIKWFSTSVTFVHFDRGIKHPLLLLATLDSHFNFFQGGNNGIGCLFQCGRNGMGYFDRDGKSLHDVLSRVAKMA